MMNKESLFVFVLAFIAAVNGACDRNALQEANCLQYADLSGANQDITQQCNSLKAISTCLDPFRATCTDDAAFMPYKTIESSLSPLCGGGTPGGMSGCSILQCNQMNQYQSQDSQLQASPEVCMAVSQFKACVMTAKSSGQCDQNALAGHDQMVSIFTTMCDGCNPVKLQECAKTVESLQQKEFQGYPTKQQINEACPNFAEFKTCIDPILVQCKTGEQSELKMQMVKGIEASQKIMEFVCNSEMKDDLIKYGEECFEKPAYMNVSKKCMKYESPPTGPDGQPKDETKDQLCSRMKDSIGCFSMEIENVCSSDAKSFVEKVANKFYNFIAEPLNCPLSADSGAPKMALQFGLLLATLLLAVFMF